MRRRWAGLLAIVLVLLGPAAGLAMSPAARRSLAHARADVARQLAAVRFPQDARKVQHDPSVRGLHLEGTFCVKSYTAWDHGFWRVPGTPESVFNWMQKHPPLHTHGVDASRSSPHSRSDVWDITAGFKDQTNVHGQMVDIQLGFAKGGGTAVRIDSEAFVNPPPRLIPTRCKIGVY